MRSKILVVGVMLCLFIGMGTFGYAESENLLINGDFSQHWSVGWNKGLEDRTQGNFYVENVPSASDAKDEMLHAKLTGRNRGWVSQGVKLPEGRTLKNLYLEVTTQP